MLLFKKQHFEHIQHTQRSWTCSKSTMETPEQRVNLFKVHNKDIRAMSLTKTWGPLSGDFIMNFEHNSHIVLVFRFLNLDE